MKIKKIELLTGEEVKEPGLLETLKESGVECYATDLARLQGIRYDQRTGFGDYWINDVHTTSNKRGKATINNMNYLNTLGAPCSTTGANFMAGVRFCIHFDDIEDFDEEKINELKLEQPMFVIEAQLSETIKRLFNNKNSKVLLETGRKHLIGKKSYKEYEVFGIRFIRMTPDIERVLTDGTISRIKNELYLRVDSIPLTVDKEKRLLYSSIIPCCYVFDYNGRQYKDSDIKKYLNNEFLNTITDNLKHDEMRLVYNRKEMQEENRYNFDYDELTEEEIAEICIRSDIAVFLHGKTGVGKTERMLSLDKDLELVDFGCTSSDGFTGVIAKDFNSKELFLYEPYWYKSLVKKCEKEPNKIHILFLEELTNAANDLQKVAFEVTLNKILTNGGYRLHLPKNAAVCAAGNESEDSRSANELSEPLFGRFAHVYIDTNSEDWLYWALKRKKEKKELIYKEKEEANEIHPAIIDFIRINGDKVLRTDYNGKTPNADPRKWALASKALYECNNPNVLRAFVGKELTHDFIKFSKIKILTVDDIINDNWTEADIPEDSSTKWYTAISLSRVDMEHVDKVREFVKLLGNELLAVFDYEWSKDSDERIIKLYNDQNHGYQKRLRRNGNN